MKKFVLKVVLFFVLVVAMDFFFGHVFSFMRTHAKGGTTANCEYIANACKEDIIILGSSRAKHHYIPQIIQDTLGLSCYNCGEEGSGIVLAYGRYRQIVERKTPKLIIYEVTPEYDYYLHDADSKYLSPLRPYYSQPCIRALVNDFGGELERLRMLSGMYRNNSKLLSYTLDLVKSPSQTNGYSPLSGQLDTVRLCDLKTVDKGELFDEHKYRYLEELLKEAKLSKIPILMVVSPIYSFSQNKKDYGPARYLCDKYNIPFIDLRNLSELSENPFFFQDVEHLNDNGARAYTMFFAQQLKQWSLR